jgi:replication-associated recombination protein RarA
VSAATEADALALALVEYADDPAMVRAVASALASLAADLRRQEQAAVPEHIRAAPRRLLPGVIAMCGRRTWI